MITIIPNAILFVKKIYLIFKKQNKSDQPKALVSVQLTLPVTNIDWPEFVKEREKMNDIMETFSMKRSYFSRICMRPECINIQGVS